MSDVGNRQGQWVVAPDGLQAWQQPDGSLWRQAPDGSWVPVPLKGTAMNVSDHAVAAQEAVRGVIRNLGTVRMVLVASLCAGVVGLVLPWQNVYVVNVSGLDMGPGKVYFFLLIGALVTTALHSRRRDRALATITVLLCALMTAIAAYYAFVPSFSYFGGSLTGVGIGLYLDAIAAAVALGAAFVDLLTTGSYDNGD